MNYMKVLVLSVLCATNSLSHCMGNKPTKEAIEAANYRLRKATKKNDLAKIKQLIAEGIADVNHVARDGSTALMWAATFNKNADIANALIKAGADVNSVNKDGYTALMYAARNKNVDSIKALIKAGADINSVNKYGNTALMYVVYYKKFNASIHLINPSQTSFARKKLETLLVIYNKNCSYLSILPKEILKIIIICMHPEEFTMDRALICSLHPQALVDNIPLENLALLIKDGALNQDTILATWQKKINGIAESLKAQKKLNDDDRQAFATEALAKITMLLANK